MADGALATPANRILRVGSHKVDGRAPGTYVNVVQPDRIAAQVGVDGEGYFNDSGNNSAIITVALLPSSASNDILSAAMVSRLPVPVVLTEIDGRTVGACARAMVVKKADVTWSDGADVRLWTLTTTNWYGTVGGMDPAAINDSV